MNPNRTVVLCIGATFWPHCTVTVVSLLEHNHGVHIVVFYEHPNSTWQNILQRQCDAHGATIEFIAFDTTLTDGLKNCKNLGPTTYYRLFTPELLDGSIKRFVYLDSDLVVKHSMDELFDLDLEDNVLAARPVYWQSHVERLSITLGRKSTIPYFNAGVLVIDAEKWRSMDLTSKTLDVVRNHPEKITFDDQCALNYCLGDAFTFLAPEWNVTTQYFNTDDQTLVCHGSHDAIYRSSHNPKIIHYIGGTKPWHHRSEHPYKKDYVRIRKKVSGFWYVSDDFYDQAWMRIKRSVAHRVLRRSY